MCHLTACDSKFTETVLVFTLCRSSTSEPSLEGGSVPLGTNVQAKCSLIRACDIIQKNMTASDSFFLARSPSL